MAGLFPLFLPALIPSWRFFDGIAPSPRIEVSWQTTPDAPSSKWHEFRPRPDRIRPSTVLRRLVWNPNWNETLFMVSCAERLMQSPSEHSHQEILKRVLNHQSEHPNARYIQFRLVFVSRTGESLSREITYMSPRHDLASLR